MSKLAYELGKQAGLTSEVVGSAIGRTPTALANAVLPGVGSMANLGLQTAVGLGAAATPTRSEEQQEHVSGKMLRNVIPGVADYNMWKRLGRTAKDYDEDKDDKDRRAKKNLNSEVIGRETSAILPAMIGTGLGGLAGSSLGGREDTYKGMAIGGVLGGITPALIATLAAAITKRRGDAEQGAYEANANRESNYFMPGKATYELWKRLGYSKKYDEAARANKEKEANK